MKNEFDKMFALKLRQHMLERGIFHFQGNLKDARKILKMVRDQFKKAKLIESLDRYGKPEFVIFTPEFRHIVLTQIRERLKENRNQRLTLMAASFQAS